MSCSRITLGPSVRTSQVCRHAAERSTVSSVSDKTVRWYWMRFKTFGQIVHHRQREMQSKIGVRQLGKCCSVSGTPLSSNELKSAQMKH
jgi:hypothetical protein